MSTTTIDNGINPARGPLMEIPRGHPFAITGMRWRSSARTVLSSVTGVTLRIGAPGSAALIEVELDEDDSDEDDPFWYVVLTAEQTEIAASAGYQYVYVDQDERVLLYGPCVVFDLPVAAA